MEHVKHEAEIPAAGLILAAGYSSRMGAFKPLLQIGDMTAVERIAAMYRKAGLRTVIGVTGFQRELLSPVLSAADILEAYNPDFPQGMFTSIKAGIVKTEGAEGFFLMLVDCPLVPAEVIRQIWDKHLECPECLIVPCYNGKKGHPLYIPAKFAPEILEHNGEGGLKAITSRHEAELIRLETGCEAVVLDMDTPEGYEELREYWKTRGTDDRCGVGTEPPDTDWTSRLRGKRLVLVRHGEIRQHKEKIFLGQTDVPLSDQGREQASAAAEELRRRAVKADRIYTSDLSRAAETAALLRDGMGGHGELIPMASLREMALGEWDGCFISEIRERFPEEYRKRGENLLTFKFGNDSENFYDLQYRVMKGFGEIVRQETLDPAGGRDILIVSHAGVINVLTSNLKQIPLEHEINSRLPNGGIIVIDFTEAKE